MPVFLLILLLLATTACSRRNPNPELGDRVYNQINNDLAAAKADLAYVTEFVATQKADLQKALPQTGEAAVYKKRVNDSLNALTYATQQVRMYEVRLAERKLYAERRYLESLTADGRKWPDEADTDSELNKLRLQREYRERIKKALPEPKKDVPRGTSEPTKQPGGDNK